MGLGDNNTNTAEDLTGLGMETAGDATGNDDLKAEGKGDQASAKVKGAAEDVKDAGKKLKDGLTS
jgi:uncharacterized protein YjbJ (UPF0337 family)